MIKVENLQLNSPDGKKLILGIDKLHLPDKGLFVILGKNGAGKTTFLKALCGLHNNYSGDIKLHSKDLNSMSLMDKRDAIQYMDGLNDLPAYLKVKDYIQLGYQTDTERLKDGIRLMCIEDLEEKMMSQLSKGQQQKAMIAKLLYSNSSALLLDEPTNYLDYKSEDNFWDVIKTESKNRLILCTIHSPQKALDLGSDIFVISNAEVKKVKEDLNLQTLVEIMYS